MISAFYYILLMILGTYKKYIMVNQYTSQHINHDYHYMYVNNCKFNTILFECNIISYNILYIFNGMQFI